MTRCAVEPFDLPTSDCPVDEAAALMDRAMRASCGTDVFCREGTRQVHTILTDLMNGQGESHDLEMVEDICSVAVRAGTCPAATAVFDRTLTLLREQADEWDRHLLRRRCASLTCPMSFTVYVNPETCTGCEKCVPACPQDAITGGDGLIHVITTGSCDNCLLCLPVCPVGAIAKAGPVKPKVPAAPVPVGSFAGATPTDGTTRRRRRRG